LGGCVNRSVLPSGSST